MFCVAVMLVVSCCFLRFCLCSVFFCFEVVMLLAYVVVFVVVFCVLTCVCFGSFALLLVVLDLPQPWLG